MRQWSNNHPKAELLTRKRAAILDAAESTFLRIGYEGASMEGIANAAGVSIMTLYRHAKSKEDLFCAVIASACDHSGEDKQVEFAKMMQMSVNDTMVKFGMLFQEKLIDSKITSLVQVAITESKRFPKLAETVYDALFADWAINLDEFLTQQGKIKNISARERKRACEAFFSRLIGMDTIRVLMGLKGNSATGRLERAQTAAAEFLAKIK